VASQGNTSVLCVAVCPQVAESTAAAASASSGGYVPLTVDYRQKAAAAGRIPTNFLRRELGASDSEILTARLIDRALRPLFPKSFSYDTNVTANLMAVDAAFDPVVLALNAASAALAVSDIPWNGPVGAVRVGYSSSEKKFLMNPVRKVLHGSDNQLNLVVAGTASKLTVMLEAEAKNLDSGLFLDGIAFGLEGCAAISQQIRSEQEKNGRSKATPTTTDGATSVQSVEEDVALLCGERLRGVFSDASHDKASRGKASFALRDMAVAQLRKKTPGLDPSLVNDAFSRVCRKTMAELMLEEGKRVDGRSADDIREISCEVDLHSPLHGSALFQRGQTQVFCTVALDSPESALKTDAISALTGGVKEKNFFLHYEFPQYATNEIGRSGSRRELGHGALAEKALKPIVPQNHPFTIRLTSEVLESNGSSSMATVCGGSMALLDAGVPISTPAAGVAVGLISRPKDVAGGPKEGSCSDGQDRDYQVLVDIMGLEDFLGDMDFKLAGTKQGVTALQADIKLPGLPFSVVTESMEKGQAGISRILDTMAACISKPVEAKANWPLTRQLTVPVHKRAKFLGAGGANIKRLLVDTGVQVTSNPTEDGVWNLFAPNAEAMEEAMEAVEVTLSEEKVPELEFGAIYKVKITEIKDRGVMVEIHPDIQQVFIGNSQLDAKKVKHPSALGLEVGQEIEVKHYGRDPTSGAIRLSRKVLTIAAASAVKQLRSSTNAPSSSSSSSSPSTSSTLSSTAAAASPQR